MDGRDSLPAVGEDDWVAPVTDGLAKEAEALFSSRRFAECVDVLNQLLPKKEGDPKVLHNIAVAEYFRDGCSDPRKLLDVLDKVKKRSEELAHSSGEQVDSAGNLGNNSSGSKGSNTNLHQLSVTYTSSVAYADEFDPSIITLNTAIVLYHLHEYAHALSLLEPLYQNIDPIDEATALHVCLLSLDIALASHDASKAADVIQYLEKCFGVGYMGNQGDNGNTPQQQSLNQGTKASTMSNAFVADASGSDSGASANINENSLSGTLSDDALEYENLFSTLDSSGQNLVRPSNELTKASANRAAPAIDLKLKMHLYKVRLLLLTRNLKAAKREVKLAMNMARGRDSSTELLLKSQLEYTRGNHRKAVKLLMTSSNRTEPGMLSIFNNNLGCIHYQLRSHHTSGLFFSKALKNSSSLCSEKPLKLSTFSQDKSLLIIYNCGIQNLACGKPLVAAKCFGKASLIFYNRPLMWLRLAECCLLALEKGLLGSSSEDIRVHVAGSGRWRQLVVDDLDPRNGYSKADNSDEVKLSLPFARYCLQNALLLLNKNNQKTLKSTTSITALDEDDANQIKSGKSSSHKNTSLGDSKATNMSSAAVNSNGDSKENKGTLSSYSTLQSSVAAYEDMRREENHMIRQAVLGALAYVELCLENPLKALFSSKSLLDLPECSKIYVFLGHIYAAEALCWLNRSKEAAEHLLVYLTDGSNVELPYTNKDKEKWSIKRVVGDCEDLNSLPIRTATEESQGLVFLMPEEARAVALVNFSTLFAMQGDLEKASRFASEALSLFPKHPKALLAAVYVDLLQEKTQEALSKLKQFSHVRYLSTNVTLSS